MFQSGLPFFASMRDEVRVERAHEQRVAEDRDAAVVGAAADARVGRRRVAVLPEHPAGPRVDGHDVVGPLGDVHDPVDDDRVRLPGAEDLVLQHPLRLEVRHVGRRDLRERAVALAGVRAVVGQPVLRLGRGLEDAIGGDLLRLQRCADARRAAHEDRREEREQRRMASLCTGFMTVL